MARRTAYLLKSVLALALLVGASSSVLAEQESCVGKHVSGPWYSFTLPDGMRLEGERSSEVESDSVWIERGSTPNRIMFFLYAPQHGGKPYQAFLGADRVIKIREFPNDTGLDQSFIVHYTDGSTGVFEGTSQRITGVRVYDRPLDREDSERYRCFLDSIESFAG